jgi:hypothetical protein
MALYCIVALSVYLCEAPGYIPGGFNSMVSEERVGEYFFPLGG